MEDLHQKRELGFWPCEVSIHQSSETDHALVRVCSITSIAAKCQNNGYHSPPRKPVATLRSFVLMKSEGSGVGRFVVKSTGANGKSPLRKSDEAVMFPVACHDSCQWAPLWAIQALMYASVAACIYRRTKRTSLLHSLLFHATLPDVLVMVQPPNTVTHQSGRTSVGPNILWMGIISNIISRIACTFRTHKPFESMLKKRYGSQN